MRQVVGLGVVPNANDEIYVSVSIGKYVITLLYCNYCFLYCAKVGIVLENIESEVATWKIVTTMQRW